MVQKRLPLLAKFACVFCAALLLAACGRGPQKGSPPNPEGSAEAPSTSVTLLYPDASTGFLAACPIALPLTGQAQPDMTQVARRYLEGPVCDGQVQPFSQGTSLRALFLLDGGVVALDLTGPAASGGGSDTETARIYGLVDTLCYNFKEITSARILVEGREVETLLGHLDLQRPVPPEWELAPAGLRPVGQPLVPAPAAPSSEPPGG